MTTDTIKSTGKRSLFTTVIGAANIILFSGFAFFGVSWILGQLGNGQGASDTVKLLIAAGILLFCLAFISLGALMFKISPTIYYEEDGFRIGKAGEKIFYKGLQYHLAPGTRPNQFLQIYYKSAGKLKKINASSYASTAFKALQKGAVEANLPEALERIEKGETLTFAAKKPSLLGRVTLQSFEEKGIQVKINKTGIALADTGSGEPDEVYSWADYRIVSTLAGTIQILEPETNKRLVNLSPNYLLAQPNVVTALIKTMGDR